MDNLQGEIQNIKERNERVEADKAWEKSYTRIVAVSVITYILAVIVMFVLEIVNPFINAVIPTLGFMLSVQSLPLIKRRWVKKYIND